MARLLGVYLFVQDVAASAAFYEVLGLEVEVVSDMLGRAQSDCGATIEFGTSSLTRSYDPDWQPPGPLAKNTIGLELESRAAVDYVFGAAMNAGYEGQVAPCDPPWGARFAVVVDPDGNQVALHSPRDRSDERRRERVGTELGQQEN